MSRRKKPESLSKRAQKAGFHRKSGVPKTKLLLKQKRNRTGRKGQRIMAGRAQKWNRPKTFTYICQRVSKGGLVTTVLRELGIDPTTLYGWIDADRTGGFAQRWKEARRMQSHAIADQAVDISSGRDGRGKAIKRLKKLAKASKDHKLTEHIKQLESTRVARNRLEAETRRWFVKVTNPREFGEKVDVTTDGEKLPPAQHVTIEFVDPPQADT